MATKDDVTSYVKKPYGYDIVRTIYDASNKPVTKQYGVAVGNMAQFLEIDPTADVVNFTETFTAPEPRRPDSFPPHVNAYKYGFGKKG